MLGPTSCQCQDQPPSQRRSSVASTKHPNLGADRPRDPIDDITVRTQCELRVLYGKKLKVCAEGYAEVQEEGGTIVRITGVSDPRGGGGE